MKYDDPSLINHGERAKPSSCSTTAAARAPTRIDDSTHPLYHPLPVVVAVADPMRAGAIFASCAANLAPLQTPQIPLQAEAQGGVAEAAGQGGSCCGTGADGIAMEFQYRAGDERRSRSPPLPTPSPPAALSTSGSGSADAQGSDDIPAERMRDAALVPWQAPPLPPPDVAVSDSADELRRQAEKARIRERSGSCKRRTSAWS